MLLTWLWPIRVLQLEGSASRIEHDNDAMHRPPVAIAIAEQHQDEAQEAMQDGHVLAGRWAGECVGGRLAAVEDVIVAEDEAAGVHKRNRAARWWAAKNIRQTAVCIWAHSSWCQQDGDLLQSEVQGL